MARRIVKAATLDEAITATREAATRGGLTISDFKGGTQAPASAASPFIVVPPEAVVLAYEARLRSTHSRITLDDLGAMLADFGWPFEGEGMPGNQLMRIVAEWVRQARTAPDDPLNFTPLFLADMARRQIPAVDLASDSTDPGEVRWGFLEMHLFAAALTRGLGQPVKTGFLDGLPIQRVSYGARAASGPCDDAKKWFGETLPGGLVGAYGGWGVGEALGASLEKAGLTEVRATQLMTALDAVATGLKIMKLGELYASANIDVDYGSEVPGHRPEPKQDAFAWVIARAGADPQQIKEYQESLKSAELAGSVRNCLETFGLPSWTDLSDVASDAESWRVKWILGRGAPKHAWHIIDRNEWLAKGHRIMQLKRASPTSAEAKYTFQLRPELTAGHPGDRLRGEVKVTAELHTAKVPGVGTLTDAMLGVMGLVKALADLGIGWFQTWVTPEADLIAPILYHEPGISILIEDENHVVINFGEKGKTLFATKAAERSRHVYAGSMRLGEDSLWHGKMQVTASGTYTTGDEKAAKALAAKYSNTENMTFEQAWKAVVDLVDDLPYCQGSYDGAQLFAVEGGFVSGADGKDQIELAFIPDGPPDYYNSSADCPWPADKSREGLDVLPTRLARGEQTAVVIDPPVKGQQRVYRQVVNMKDLYSSTTTTVGADFTTGDN